jgi:hypothetical protein
MESEFIDYKEDLFLLRRDIVLDIEFITGQQDKRSRSPKTPHPLISPCGLNGTLSPKGFPSPYAPHGEASFILASTSVEVITLVPSPSVALSPPMINLLIISSAPSFSSDTPPSPSPHFLLGGRIHKKKYVNISSLV